MKKFFFLSVACVLVVSLSGCCLCTTLVQDTTSSVEQLETLPVFTAPVMTEAPETIAPTEPPLPEHSAFYIPGMSVENVIYYFSEVCLDAEYSTGSGNPRLIQKWTIPIRYRLYGEYTEADLEIWESFAQWLNSVEGFPGMWPAEEDEMENMSVYFCLQDTLVERMGADFYDSDGGVTFWYRDNEIYEATICYRSDLSQFIRNSVILEELYNGLGPVQDSNSRPDSVIYSGYSEPQSMTLMDMLIMQLLYHPDIQCGMDYAACEAVILSLYY